MRDEVSHVCHRGPRKLARPTGLEPVTFGSGGRGKEATRGSGEPLPPDFIHVPATPDHPRPPRTSPQCQSFVSRLFVFASSERRTAATTLVPKRQDLDALRVAAQPVIQVVTNSRQVEATNARKGDVYRACANLGLDGNNRRSALNFFPNRIRRFRPIETPPFFGSANLRLREIADVDLERATHSRLRISARKSFSGVTCPRRHCAIASSSIFSVSGSASNVSSPSGANTVTDVPSGSSASSSTRPSTTFPGAIRIWAL